ncbi:MAG: class I SAM-dependent methyltransferase [Acidobacteriota bacterium]
MMSAVLQSEFGEIDIYLFDQFLKGRFDGCRTVLDAGCGDGRNLVYLLRRGLTCFGIDRDARAIDHVRALAARLVPGAPDERFQVGELDHLPWAGGTMDAVVASAVLHFAADADHFSRMLLELWRVVAPGGLLFARLASTIGLDGFAGMEAGRQVRLPDGSDRFVVDEAMLLEWTARLGGRLLDPIKTTNVQQQRCMTTWCVGKPTGAREGGPAWR